MQKKQVATVMVATARIADEHGSFNTIRQMAPITPPIHGPLGQHESTAETTSCRNVSLITPMVSGVAGLNASSSSKADTLNV